MQNVLHDSKIVKQKVRGFNEEKIDKIETHMSIYPSTAVACQLRKSIFLHDMPPLVNALNSCKPCPGTIWSKRYFYSFGSVIKSVLNAKQKQSAI